MVSMTKFEKLHKKSLKQNHEYFRKVEEYNLPKEYFEKNAMFFIKHKNFMDNHILKRSYDYQDSELFCLPEVEREFINLTIKGW